MPHCDHTWKGIYTKSWFLFCFICGPDQLIGVSFSISCVDEKGSEPRTLGVGAVNTFPFSTSCEIIGVVV